MPNHQFVPREHYISFSGPFDIFFLAFLYIFKYILIIRINHICCILRFSYVNINVLCIYMYSKINLVYASDIDNQTKYMQIIYSAFIQIDKLDQSQFLQVQL